MTTAYTSLLGLALPVTGELSGTWGDTVNTAITSLLDSAVAGTTSITTDADITLTTTTGASNQARQAIILWNPASGTTTRYITAPAQSKLYTVINASGGTQSVVIRGAGPTTGVTIAKGESAMVAWNGSDFVKVSSSGGAITFTDLTVTGNTILGDAAADTLTVNATSTFAAPVNFQGLVKLPSTGRSAAAALTVTAPAFLYGVASTYTDTTSSGTIAAMAPFYSIAQPTLSTSNVTTYTNASTLYIANAPAAGGSATITNPYSLYVAAGNAYFGAKVLIGDTTDASSTTTGSFQTLGGVGIAKTLYVGTSIYMQSGRLYVKTAGTDSNGLNIYRSTSDTNYITDYFDGTLYLGVNNTYQLYMNKSRVYTNVDAELNGVRAGNGPGNYSSNTLFGRSSLAGSVTGGYNTVVGYNSANAITSGNENVAIGSAVLNATVDGVRNTAVGNNALQSNVSGGYNVALGMLAANSIVGSQNVAVGYDALSPASLSNLAGNVAIGYQAVKLTGYSNMVGVGYQALYSGGGGNEVAVGYRALYSGTTSGGVNTAVGYEAMNAVTGAARNVAMGYRALYGSGATPAPNDNVAIGHSAMLNATTAYYNVAIGESAAQATTSGANNVIIGYQAGYGNQTSNSNTMIGYQSGYAVTAGSQTAVGYRSLYQTTVSGGNTAIGYESAYANVRNSSDAKLTAVGQQALYGSTQGYESTAVGYRSMFTDLSGRNNTAFGFQAMYGGVGGGSGYYNVAIGGDAMSGLTNGFQNVGVGKNALIGTSTGAQNVAVGSFALSTNSSGTLNVAVGDYAGQAAGTASYNVFVGGVAGYNTTGGKNTYVGYGAGYLATSGTDNVAVGYLAYDNQTATGSENTAVGSNALYNATTATGSVAMGYLAGRYLTTATQTTAVGYRAMGAGTVTGNFNTALGTYAGSVLASGDRNTLVGGYAGYTLTGSRNTFVGGMQTNYGAGELVTSGNANTILGAFSGLESGVLDIRTSSNNIVLSDGDGRAQFFGRYYDTSTMAYRLRSGYHSVGTLYSTGSINSGSSVALNVNGTGNDGSCGFLAVATRWTSQDGGDSFRIYAHGHGNTYNYYTSIAAAEVNSITISESSGVITISNGSAYALNYEFVYLNYTTGELTRQGY